MSDLQPSFCAMKNINYTLKLLLFSAVLLSAAASAETLTAVQIYSQDELLNLIGKNKHLQRVKADDCQLVEDIKARSEKMKVPAYQFLYGDMLLYGVCVDKNVNLGMDFIHQSANQGLPDALEQLGRYYNEGRFVRKDKNRATEYFYAASSVGHLRAQMQLIELYNAGYGAPHDYYYAYHWLHNAIIEQGKDQQKAEQLLAQLSKKMPETVVTQAKQPLER
ncbi:tetratricopeptide repeat protein [Echinimonas agarilytica]|uniref:Sel1 repeat family protein n=1 Tax=Echinimonas agarilytica TaxID=1215918 RepID=A0AA42B675_9GAMM|nr:tetratricopeptide repeat protein [Echinimonas agarilytica]MCM2678472.1 sel1 repeat family protein [Echinimonas agarilytica]